MVGLLIIGLLGFSGFMVLSFEGMRVFQTSRRREAFCLLLNVALVGAAVLFIRWFDVEIEDARVLYLVFNVPMALVFGVQYRSVGRGVLTSLVVLLTAFSWEGLAVLVLQFWVYGYASKMQYMVAFLGAVVFVSGVVFLFRRFLRDRIDMNVFHSPAAYAVTVVTAGVLLLVHLVRWGEAVEAVRHLAYNVLVLAGMAMVCVVVRYMYREYALEAGRQAAAVSWRYVRDLEEAYTTLQTVRRGQVEVMACLDEYVDSRDMDGLGEALERWSREGLGRDRWVESLAGIQNREVRSVLMYKCAVAAVRRVEVVVEAVEPVGELGVSAAVVCQVLGILLDNAMEAAEQTEAKQLAVAVLQVGGAALFVIRNTWNPEEIPVDRLFELGFSTKAGDRGAGLYTVRGYIEKVGGLYLETVFDASDFTQILTVRG